MRLTKDELPTLGRTLGEGGQAYVYELNHAASTVYKSYKPGVRPRASALDELIQWRCRLDASDQEYVDARSAWPLRRVTEDRRTVGVIMNAIPDQFYADLETGSTKPRELQYLVRPASCLDLGIEYPSNEERLVLVHELFDFAAFLARQDVILGDISEKNILWSTAPQPAVYIIDCDTARFDGSLPPLEVAQTPGYVDPNFAGHPHADSFKLALAAWRMLSGDPTSSPHTTHQLPFEASIFRSAASLALSDDPARRPSVPDLASAAQRIQIRRGQGTPRTRPMIPIASPGAIAKPKSPQMKRPMISLTGSLPTAPAPASASITPGAPRHGRFIAAAIAVLLVVLLGGVVFEMTSVTADLETCNASGAAGTLRNEGYTTKVVELSAEFLNQSGDVLLAGTADPIPINPRSAAPFAIEVPEAEMQAATQCRITRNVEFDLFADSDAVGEPLTPESTP